MKKINVIKKLKIYVCCGIKDVPEEFSKIIAEFKKILTQYDFIQVLEFVPSGETKKDIPRDLYVYFNDIHTCVKQADLLLGDLTYNSFGLGFEMGTACEKHGTPIIMCHKKEYSISSIARGAAMVHENITIFPYKKSISETECLEFLIEKIKTYAKNSGYITEEDI